MKVDRVLLDKVLDELDRGELALTRSILGSIFGDAYWLLVAPPNLPTSPTTVTVTDPNGRTITISVQAVLP